jgi:hypothetical protein
MLNAFVVPFCPCVYNCPARGYADRHSSTDWPYFAAGSHGTAVARPYRGRTRLPGTSVHIRTQKESAMSIARRIGLLIAAASALLMAALPVVLGRQLDSCAFGSEKLQPAHQTSTFVRSLPIGIRQGFTQESSHTAAFARAQNVREIHLFTMKAGTPADHTLTMPCVADLKGNGAGTELQDILHPLS